MRVVMNILLGFPGEEDSEARATLALVRELKPWRASVSVYTPYEGTPKSKELPSIGITDYASLFHTNPRLLGFSGVREETLQEFLTLAEELGSGGRTNEELALNGGRPT